MQYLRFATQRFSMSLLLAAISANFGLAITGIFYGWSSPSLPLLSRADSQVQLNTDQSSWVASLFTLGATSGPIISYFLVNRIGRKYAILSSAIPSITGLLMIMFAATAWELYLSRFISGIGVGLTYSVTPMYFGEVSPPKVRGILSTVLSVNSRIGMLLIYCIGPFLSVKNMALFSLILPFLFVITGVWMPESPYYLMRRGLRNEATESLIRLRGKNNVEEEINIIARSVKEDLENGTGFRDIFKVPGNRRAFITCIGLISIQQLSGSQVLVSYSQTIFDQIGSGLDGKYVTMILGTVQVVASAICAILTDRTGRKPLLLISSFGSCLSIAMVALCFNLNYSKVVDTSNLGVIAAVGAILYSVTYSIGLLGLPFTMIGELFPTNVKGLASICCIVCLNLISFIVVQTYQLIAEIAGIHTAFWFYSTNSFAGTVFIFYYVPETKGKTLQMIQEKLNASKKLLKEKEFSGVCEKLETFKLLENSK